MENEHDRALEREFEKFSYDEIHTILVDLGTIFLKPIESIPKQHIYATIEGDYPLEKIRTIMKKVKKERA